jgi:hypothetical protein
MQVHSQPQAVKAASNILLSGETSQELTEGPRAGPPGALFGRIGTASQSYRQRLAVTINLPSPSPRIIGVRLLHDDMVSRGYCHKSNFDGARH